MTTFGLESPSAENVSPSLSLGDFRGQRYPNQFFDLGQQYMPPTIKELFRWCTFYYYNSPLIGSALKKVSRYPITDLILEDDIESNRAVWQKILVKTLKIKDRLMEINLDAHVYGNAFVSAHLPFTRFLICKQCSHRQPISQWKWDFKGASFDFSGTCPSCSHTGEVEVKDVPYRDIKGVRIIRWNPENIHIKFNEYTGRYIYMYSVPPKLRTMIQRGDRDVLEDIPLVVLEALKKRRMVRFNPDSIFHIKSPTLAEQDQGWGKPTIIHVLKDMFYLYTLRRAQEAIAMEHIVPFDIIYPMPNAQMDPYVHTDLASWRIQLEAIIKKHRRDPNFKAVIPVPVGFGRLGGDGKALLLSPEMNYLTQTIVGGMGIPQEFLFGNLSWSGSSVTLRMLENDFIQNRSQLLDFVVWIKDKLRVWMGLPDIHSIRMADFRMADDVQRNQQLIGLNAQGKVSDHTLLSELGFDFEQEMRKMMEESYAKSHLGEVQGKSNARTQGEAQLVQFNYQQRMQELAAEAQALLQQKQQQEAAAAQPSGGAQGVDMLPEQQAEEAPQEGAPSSISGSSVQKRLTEWAKKISGMPPDQAQATLNEIKLKMPDMGQALEQRLSEVQAGPAAEVNMDPMPEQKPPRRAGAV